uniref:Uncharacterized protein n=1 Tax=Micrurus carvalhoi TaxID=3147026 RepID=A0A2H6N932_9SAUR
MFILAVQKTQVFFWGGGVAIITHISSLISCNNFTPPHCTELFCYLQFLHAPLPLVSPLCLLFLVDLQGMVVGALPALVETAGGGGVFAGPLLNVAFSLRVLGEEEKQFLFQL